MQQYISKQIHEAINISHSPADLSKEEETKSTATTNLASSSPILTSSSITATSNSSMPKVLASLIAEYANTHFVTYSDLEVNELFFYYASSEYCYHMFKYIIDDKDNYLRRITKYGFTKIYDKLKEGIKEPIMDRYYKLMKEKLKEYIFLDREANAISLKIKKAINVRGQGDCEILLDVANLLIKPKRNGLTYFALFELAVKLNLIHDPNKDEAIKKREGIDYYRFRFEYDYDENARLPVLLVYLTKL